MQAREQWARRRGGRIVAALLLVALALYWGGKMYRKALKPRSDYAGFLSGARAVLAGESVVTAHSEPTDDGTRPFWYLPWVAMAMVPLVVVPPPVAAAAWTALNLAALGASSYFCLKVARGASEEVPWPVCAVPVLMAFRALDSNFGLAQINVVLLGLISLGLYLYASRRDVCAGLALGAATALKITPALLIAYFAWKREWRLVASGLVAAVVLTLVVPMPLYGVRGGWDSALQWADAHVLSRARQSREDGYVAGQSLRAITFRLLTPSQSAAHTERVLRLNVLSVSQQTANAAYWLSAVLVLAAVAVASFGRGDRGKAARTATELSLVVLAMLLVSPYSRKAHFVLLMLPASVAYSHLALAEKWRHREKLLLAGVAVSVALASITSRGLIGDTASCYLTALGCMGWGTLALFAALLCHRWPARASDHRRNAG